MATKFYLCPICGNVVAKIEDGGPVPVCCGEEMNELQPGTVDASVEKHVPIIEKVDSCTVKVVVGSEEHPMTSEHHIDFIWLETIHGGQLRYLSMKGVTAKKAVAEFCNCKDPVVAVYSYCNLHGLWKSEVSKDFCSSVSDKRCCQYF